mmetsp:Transcript_43485/g.68926  ORF Transcript_43485/g.68926 Transcript_43485/m.68926 type:complete len:252 (+) Transcript_43485:105-860(+)
MLLQQSRRLRSSIQGSQSFLEPIDLLLFLGLLLCEGLWGHQAFGFQALHEVHQGPHLRLKALLVGVEAVQLGIQPLRFRGLVADVLLLLHFLQLHVLHVLVEVGGSGLLSRSHLRQTHGHVRLHILQATNDASSSTLALAAGHLNPRVLVEVTESPQGGLHTLHPLLGLWFFLRKQVLLFRAELRHVNLSLRQVRQLRLDRDHLLLKAGRLGDCRINAGAHGFQVGFLLRLLVSSLSHLRIAVGLLGGFLL